MSVAPLVPGDARVDSVRDRPLRQAVIARSWNVYFKEETGFTTLPDYLREVRGTAGRRKRGWSL